MDLILTIVKWGTWPFFMEFRKNMSYVPGSDIFLFFFLYISRYQDGGSFSGDTTNQNYTFLKN